MSDDGFLVLWFTFRLSAFEVGNFRRELFFLGELGERSYSVSLYSLSFTRWAAVLRGPSSAHQALALGSVSPVVLHPPGVFRGLPTWGGFGRPPGADRYFLLAYVVWGSYR